MRTGPDIRPDELDLRWLRRANAAITALEKLYHAKPFIETVYIAPECWSTTVRFVGPDNIGGPQISLGVFKEKDEADLYTKALSVGKAK